MFSIVGWAAWLVIFGILVFEFLIINLRSDDDSEMVGFGAFCMWLTIAALVLFTDIANPVVHHVTWANATLAVSGYLVAGVLWSFKEWIDYLKDQLTLAKRRTSKTGTELAQYLNDMRPNASENKGRLTGYMVLWPMYFVTWVILLPRHVYTWIYEQLTSVYDAIAKKVFA